MEYKVSFSVNRDFEDLFSRQVADDGATIWLNFNPYDKIFNGKSIREIDLGSEIETAEGAKLKLIEKGSAGWFGKDSFSWQWARFELMNCSLA